jgi:hypothetical protein
MGLGTRIQEGLRRTFYAGYAPVRDGAKALSQGVRSRVVGAMTGYSNPMLNIAEQAVETLKNKIRINGNDENSSNARFFFFDSKGDFYDEGAAKQLLTDISIDLTLPDGRLNKKSVLLNDGGAISSLINLSADSDFSEKFRLEVKDLLVQLVNKSAKQRGILSKGCPQYLVDILSNSSPEDDQKARVIRHQAVAKLITSLADKNQKRLDVQETVSNFLNDMPRYFHGQVADQVRPIIENSINEFLSNPTAVLTDRDLEVHPDVLRAYAQSLGDLFESGVTKPLRNDSLVQAAKNLISAFEDQDRDYGGQGSSIGISKAREAFIDQWIDERVNLINLSRDIARLKELRESVRQGIETGINHVKIDRQFCTTAEQATSADAVLIVKPSNIHLLEVDKEIRNLEAKNLDATSALNTKLIAIKSSFENIASPSNDGDFGVKNLFFERLFGRNEEGDKISEKDFLDHFLSEYDDAGIDYSKLSDPDYGADFTGVKKLMLGRLREISSGLSAEITMLQRYDIELDAERTALDTTFWNPLKEMLPLDKHMDQAYIDQLTTNLQAFCHEENQTSTAMQKIEALKNKSQEIIQHIITVDVNTNKYTLNTGILDREAPALNVMDYVGIEHAIGGIATVMDGFYSKEENKGKPFDWSLCSINDINIILETLREKVVPVKSSETEENDDRSTKTLGHLVAEESSAYQSAMVNIAKVFQYEQAALKSAPTALAAKITSFASAMSMPLVNVEVLVSSDLATTIPRAQTLSEISNKNKTLIEKYQAMQDPTHARFVEYWDQQAKNTKMDSVFSSATNQDLISMGLDLRNARILEKAIEDYSYSLDLNNDREFSFTAIIDKLLKSLISLIQSLGVAT